MRQFGATVRSHQIGDGTTHLGTYSKSHGSNSRGDGRWYHMSRYIEFSQLGSDKLAFKQFDRYVTLGSYCCKRMNALFWQDAVYSNYKN